MAILQQVVDLARLPLNDVDKDRHSDPDLLTHVIHGLLIAWRRRPDLFFGAYDDPPSLNMKLTSRFPLDDAYVQAVADYAVARMEGKDAEEVSASRAAAYFSLFGEQLNG